MIQKATMQNSREGLTMPISKHSSFGRVLLEGSDSDGSYILCNTVDIRDSTDGVPAATMCAEPHSVAQSEARE